MRARVLHLGVAGAASALLVGGLLPTAAAAAPADGPHAQALDGDLGVEQMVSSYTPTIGSTVTYKVKARNLGTTDVANASVSFTLPPTFTFVSAVLPALPWDCDTPSAGYTGSVVCTHVLFPDGDVADIEIRAIPESVGSATSVAAVAATGDPTPANDEVSVPVNVEPMPGTLQDPGDPGDPGYPHGWFRGGGYGYGYGGYGDYCDYGCY